MFARALSGFGGSLLIFAVVCLGLVGCDTGADDGQDSSVSVQPEPVIGGGPGGGSTDPNAPNSDPGQTNDPQAPTDPPPTDGPPADPPTDDPPADPPTDDPPADPPTDDPPVDPPTDDPPPPAWDPGVEINQGWIGGACEDGWDCSSGDFSQSPQCLTDGFPGGYCTQACAQAGSGSWICPDTDYGPSTSATTSRCVTTADGSPTCATECDFTKSPSGCRPGYSCVLRQRHGDPGKIYPICLPQPEGLWPGESGAPFDIGDSCWGDGDCEHLSCLSLPGGYCTRMYCEHSGCPVGSTCYGFEGGSSACLKDCSVDGQCRTSEGYICDTYGSCWPDQTAVPTAAWDPSVGDADCASVWTGGLSPCDWDPDTYVVVRKGARNLAFCVDGEAVANYHIGLGFTPSGDKKVEGDGKTPEGTFYVANTLPNSQYYKAYLLSYPDAADAAWGQSQGLINGATASQITDAQDDCGIPPQTTALGGYIEIHGEGGGQDWTAGCVAIDNGEMDELWSTMAVGDTIVVLP